MKEHVRIVQYHTIHNPFWSYFKRPSKPRFLVKLAQASSSSLLLEVGRCGEPQITSSAGWSPPTPHAEKRRTDRWRAEQKHQQRNSLPNPLSSPSSCVTFPITSGRRMITIRVMNMEVENHRFLEENGQAPRGQFSFNFQDVQANSALHMWTLCSPPASSTASTYIESRIRTHQSNEYLN